jgi:hypothetical protein
MLSLSSLHGNPRALAGVLAVVVIALYAPALMAGPFEPVRTSLLTSPVGWGVGSWGVCVPPPPPLLGGRVQRPGVARAASKHTSHPPPITFAYDIHARTGRWLRRLVWEEGACGSGRQSAWRPAKVYWQLRRTLSFHRSPCSPPDPRPPVRQYVNGAARLTDAWFGDVRGPGLWPALTWAPLPSTALALLFRLAVLPEETVGIEALGHADVADRLAPWLHTFAVACHVTLTLGAFVVARQLFADGRAACVVGLVVACHPLAAGTVRARLTAPHPPTRTALH